MTEPENLMLEHLRAIRGEIAELADVMRSMSVEMTSMRQHLAGVVTPGTRSWGGRDDQTSPRRN